MPASGICIILGAVYTLKMIQKVLYGNTNSLTETGTDIGFNEKLVLGIIVTLIIIAGVYPQPILDLTKDTTELILNKSNIIPFLKK